MDNLAAKYRPKSLNDVVEQDVVVSIVKNICQSKEITNRNFLFIGPAGCGKAQTLDSKILTTSGFKLMKDIKVGDEVFTGKGNKGLVSGVYPQGIRPIYEIKFSDRTSIKVSDEHLNVFYRYNEDKKCREDYCMTTLDLIQFFNESRFKLRGYIPKVDWDRHSLPVDPYLLGVLLGDGSLHGNFGLSNGEKDIIDKVDYILRRDWNKQLVKVPGDNVDYNISSNVPNKYRYTFYYKNKIYKTCESFKIALHQEGYPKFDSETLVRMSKNDTPNIFKKYPELFDQVKCETNPDYHDWTEGDPLWNALSDLDMFHKSIDKHIPSQYLYSDKESRLNLLRGLFDTDGHIALEGTVEFSTSSPQLSEDFAFLVRSLGIRDTVVEYDSKYRPKGAIDYISTGHKSFTHNLKIPNDLVYYSSEKHSNRWKRRLFDPIRNIESISYLGEEECQCIMIDHPDHTYITDGFNVTHNTTTARIIANALNDNKGSIIEIDAASHSGVESMREIMAQAKTYPVGSKYKVFIIDECFSADTRIATQGQPMCISQIEPGMLVKTLTGYEKVLHVFRNSVNTNRLACVTLKNGTEIFTTVDHLFFTKKGWKKASELKEYDELYSEEIVQSVMRYLQVHNIVPDKVEEGHGIITNFMISSDICTANAQPALVEDEEGNHWDRYSHEYPLVEYSKRIPEFETKVESVRVYTQGENDYLFEKRFPEIRNKETITLYDLEVEGHPSYFANSVLVHNCHAFSQAAWQSALLTIESQPAMSIFCWCVAGDGMVVTNSGFKPISEVVVGERVFDGFQFNKVLNVFDKGMKECMKITFSDDTYIKCTPDHKIEMIGNKDQLKWVKAKDIRLDEICLSYTKDIHAVPSIVSVVSLELIGEEHVYDIEVENSHKFLYNNHITHNCTTNPEKIPATILSRVQTFQLSKISLSGIYNRLKYIIEQENKEGAGITYDDDAILFIAKTACGGMRNGITALDKALMFDKHITIQSLEKSLGLPNYDEYFDMLNAIAKKDNEKIVKMINSVYNSGVNFVKWFDGFFSFITNIVKYIYIQDINATMIPSIYADKISKYNSAHAALCLKLSNKLVKLNQELKTTQYLQELAISYLCTAPVVKK